MKLLREIRNAVVDPHASLSAVLRKAKILAVLLANQEFRTWVDSELNGYTGELEVPSYRQLKSQVLADCSGSFGESIKGYQLPISLMPDSLKKMAVSLRMGNPVRELETLAATAGEDLRHPWPAETVLLLRGQTVPRPEFEVIEVYQPITKAQLEALLDAVRNRLLEFVLGLQELDPSVLDSEEALSRIPGEAVSQVFNISIHGDHNVLASGAGVTQHVTKSVPSGDKARLRAYLKELGVEPGDLAALDRAIEADGPPTGHSLGSRVTEWLGRIIGKAADGTWKTAVAAAPNLLTKAISSYYGWDK